MIFETKAFARFAQQQRIADTRLREAVARAERGQIDADLGRGVLKQRVARAGQGRSGGYRVLVAYRVGVRAVFLYGFAKNERENITSDELATLRDLAKSWLEADAAAVARAVAQGILVEAGDGDQDEEN